MFNDKRFQIAYCGRRGGKTFSMIAKAGLKALSKPKQNIVYIAPTAEQAKEIFWADFVSIWGDYLVRSLDSYPQKAYFKNGSQLMVYSGHKIDRIRGLGLDLAMMDESSDQDSKIYTEVLRPALSDREGELIIAGTPKGLDWVYDLKEHDYFAFNTWTTLQGGLVSKEEVERAKSELDERTFRQEYEASFETYEGNIFYQLSEDNLSKIEYVKGRRTVISYDFNVDPMSCLVFQYVDGWHCVKEFIIPNSNTWDTSYLVKDFLAISDYRELDVTGDASGQSRNTKASDTDYDIIKKVFQGCFVKLPSKNPLKEDRWNTTNTALKSYDGKIRLYINPNTCPITYRNLQRVTRKDYKIDYHNLTHSSDAFSYLAYNYIPIRHL